MLHVHVCEGRTAAFWCVVTLMYDARLRARGVHASWQLSFLFRFMPCRDERMARTPRVCRWCATAFGGAMWNAEEDRRGFVELVLRPFPPVCATLPCFRALFARTEGGAGIAVMSCFAGSMRARRCGGLAGLYALVGWICRDFYAPFLRLHLRMHGIHVERTCPPSPPSLFTSHMSLALHPHILTLLSSFLRFFLALIYIQTTCHPSSIRDARVLYPARIETRFYHV